MREAYSGALGMLPASGTAHIWTAKIGRLGAAAALGLDRLTECEIARVYVHLKVLDVA